MLQKIRYITAILLITAGNSAYGAETATDTIPMPEEIQVLNFESNLDSLIYLWYVQQVQQPDSIVFPVITGANSLLPDFPDSVYMERISKIPSVIDLSYNRIVRNFINVYTNERRENLEIMLGLTNFYFPVFEDIFDFYGLPTELKYMSVIESALNPRAVSKAGATGIWQFMYSTGRMYGLTINSLVDERRDPIKSTHAAARYLKDLYDIYGDWILVIAAYNCGPGNVRKAIRRAGPKKNYWDIYYYLPRETRGHIPAYIAATYLMNYYYEHNLHPRNIELPLVTDTIMINEDLHLKQVAEVLDIPIKMLRDLNPQYRMDIVPGNNKGFSLTLPFEFSLHFIDLQDSILAYKDSVYFSPHNVITNPTRSRYVPEPPTGKTKLYYTVKSGDNLGYIAEWYNVRASDLRYWNNIRRNLIRTGQKLAVYVSPDKVQEYKKINSMTFEEKQKSIGASTVRPEEILANQEPLDDSYIYYTVKYGDTLWDIAKKYPGVTETDLMKINNLKNAKRILPGQNIKIRKKS
jgi:membrane-bound lytic murein transglycosylase D